MIFNKIKFKTAAQAGTLKPPHLFSPLFDVSRQALNAFDKRRSKPKSLFEHYDELEKRMPKSTLSDVRLATALAWRGSNGYFPAYRYHVGEFLNDEWLSCVDWHKTFHRDHVSHQVMCYWVAKQLVLASGDNVSFGALTLRDRCIAQIIESDECKYLRDYATDLGVFTGIDDESGKRFLWQCLFDESLYLATMFHDIGYPWQFVQGITSQFQDHSPILQPACSDPNRLYADYGQRLVCYPLHGYQVPKPTLPVVWRNNAIELLRLGQTKTHGLPGSLAFLYLNDIVRNYPTPQVNNARGIFCLEWAAMAIMMHDMQKIYWGEKGKPKPEYPFLRVCFERDPLSFLVTLVDQIQDFSRPNAKFDPCVDDAVDITYNSSCQEVVVEATLNGPMKITYFFREHADYVMNKLLYKSDAEKDFFDPSLGYVTWKGLPITSIHLDAQPKR